MTKHSHYKKPVSSLEFVDVYRVLSMFEVTHPALQHAAKKVLCAGQRGGKDWARDVQEAIDSLQRALEMHREDEKPMDLKTKVERINRENSVFPLLGGGDD